MTRKKKEAEDEELESLVDRSIRELPDGAIFAVAQHESRIKVRAEQHRNLPIQTLDQRDRKVDPKDLYGTKHPRKRRK